MTTSGLVDNARGYRSVFTSNTLKLIAVAAMVCDHYCVAFITTDMHPLRWIGRIGFPVFAFLIARGAEKTRSIEKYMLRLFLFAFVSEIPFDLVLWGRVSDWRNQNVFFTLAAGLFSIMALQKLEKKGGLFPLFGVAPLLAVTALCIFLRTDYCAGGALSIFLFYVAERARAYPYQRVLLIVAAVLAPCISYSFLRHGFRWNANEMGAMLALPLLLLYNGERGRIRINKYLFYAFYPAHLLLFGLIRVLWPANG